MTIKKYILSFLLAGSLAGLFLAPIATSAIVAPKNNDKIKGAMGWQAMSRPEVLGTVTAISGNIITVKDLRGNANTTYTVDAANATVIKNGTASTVSAIAVNDTISVQGVLNGTNITAAKINDGLLPKEKENIMGKPRIIGTVTAVSGNKITITDNNKKVNSGVFFTVDAANATIMKNGNTATVSSIVVGDKVSIQGTASGLNITATKINVGQNENELENEKNLNNPVVVGDGSPIIAGTVATVSGNTITIKNKSNIIYTIEATNAKVQSQGTVVTVSNIAVGDNVIVQGTINGTSVTASLIIDQKPKPTGAQNTPGNQNENSGNQNKPKPAGFFGKIGNWFKGLFGF